MKRLWSTPEFVRRQRIRARKLTRRRRSAEKLHLSSTRRRTWSRLSRVSAEQISLKAPRVLKLFSQPDETLAYCNKLRSYLARPGATVFLDFGDVESFTTDALLLIRSAMDSSSRARQTHVRGNLPSDPGVAAEFKASGFFAGFAIPPANLPEAKGVMLKRSQNIVYSRVAAEIVDFARRYVAVTTPCANACSQNLVELMTNVHNHAAGKKTRGKEWRRRHRKTWFASVYCRDGKAYFNFIDLGVGILKSAPARTLARRIQKTGMVTRYGHSRLLSDAFRGLVGSATREPGRGLGLPRMRKDARQEKLSKLQVLTSDVIGTVADLEFRPMNESLRGTAFSWRAGEETGGQ